MTFVQLIRIEGDGRGMHEYVQSEDFDECLACYRIIYCIGISLS